MCVRTTESLRAVTCNAAFAVALSLGMPPVPSTMQKWEGETTSVGVISQ